MEPFESISKRFREFSENIYDIALDEVKVNEESITEICKDRIYNEGVRLDGTKFKRKDKTYSIYSPAYEKKKRKLGLYQGYVDFNLTGEFLKTVKVEIKENFVYLTGYFVSGDWDLVSYFEDVYEGVLGLKDEEWDKVGQEIIMPRLTEELTTIW